MSGEPEDLNVTVSRDRLTCPRHPGRKGHLMRQCTQALRSTRPGRPHDLSNGATVGAALSRAPSVQPSRGSAPKAGGDGERS